MSLQTPPYVVSAAAHSAALFRQLAAVQLGDAAGVMGANECLVSQQSTPNMSVVVAPGRVLMLGSQLSAVAGFPWTPQGAYFALNDAPSTVTIASSNPTNPRIDVVYAAARDAFYAGSDNDAVLQVATGVPSATPVVPGIPDNATALAHVAVGAGVSSIIDNNITNVAPQSKSGQGRLLGSAAGTTPRTLNTLGQDYAFADAAVTFALPVSRRVSAFGIATVTPNTNGNSHYFSRVGYNAGGGISVGLLIGVSSAIMTTTVGIEVSANPMGTVLLDPGTYTMYPTVHRSSGDSGDQIIGGYLSVFDAGPV